MFIYLQSKNLTPSYKKQIKSLYLQYLCDDIEEITPDNLNEKMGLVDNATISILPLKRSIIAMAFLLCPTLDNLMSQEEIYRNIKDQGVKYDTDVYLYNVVVREKDRGKGYATNLLLDIEKEMVKQNKKRIILCVHDQNKEAIALYNKLKYKVILAAPKGFVMEKVLIH